MKKWNKTKDGIPQIDGNYLVIKTDSKFIEHLVFNSYYQSWDDSSGDDYKCDIDKVAYWMLFPDIPEELKIGSKNKEIER